MLVVVAILGLVAGLSVPAIGRAKAFSQQTTCTANLRTLHQSSMNYAADFDGRFPVALHPHNNYALTLSGASDFYPTPGYVGLGGANSLQRFASWSALRSQQKPFCFWCPATLPLPQASWASYAMNIFVGGNGDNWNGNAVFYPNLKVHQVASPTKTALYMDGYFGPEAGGYRTCVGDQPNFLPSPAHPPSGFGQRGLCRRTCGNAPHRNHPDRFYRRFLDSEQITLPFHSTLFYKYFNASLPVLNETAPP